MLYYRASGSVVLPALNALPQTWFAANSVGLPYVLLFQCCGFCFCVLLCTSPPAPTHLPRSHIHHRDHRWPVGRDR